MLKYYRMGRVQTELETTEDSLSVFSQVYTRDFTSDIHPVQEDTLVAVNDSSAAFDIPWYSVFQAVFGFIVVSFGAFWLNLQLLFPHSKTILQNHPVWTYLIVYFPIPALILLQLVGLPSVPMIYVLIIALQITIGFVIFSRQTVGAHELATGFYEIPHASPVGF